VPKEASKQRLKDEEILALVIAGDTDLLGQMTREEQIRSVRLINTLLAPKEGTRELSVRRLAGIRSPTEQRKGEATQAPERLLTGRAQSIAREEGRTGVLGRAASAVEATSEVAGGIMGALGRVAFPPDRPTPEAPAEPGAVPRTFSMAFKDQPNPGAINQTFAKSADFLRKFMTPHPMFDKERLLAIEAGKEIGKEIVGDISRVAQDPEFIEEEPGRALFAAADIATAGTLAARRLPVAFVRTVTRAAQTAEKAEDVISVAARAAVEAKSTKAISATMGGADNLAKSAQQAAIDARAGGDVSEDTIALMNRVEKKAEAAKAKLVKDVAPTAAKQAEELRVAQVAGEKAAKAEEAVRAAEKGAEAAKKRFGSEAGFARQELVTRMAGTSMGGAIGAVMNGREDDGTFSIPGAIIGGTVGAIGGLFITTPETLRGMRFKVTMPDGQVIDDIGSRLKVEQLVKKGGKAEFTGPDFEKAVTDVMRSFLPDRDIVVANQVLNPWKTWQQLFTESRGLSPRTFEVRQRMLDARNGRIAEIRDTMSELSKARAKDKETILRFMKGDIGPKELPDAFRESAVNARYHFDELALDLIEVSPELSARRFKITGTTQAETATVSEADPRTANVLTRALQKGRQVEEIPSVAEIMVNNLGTYVPQLYMKFERTDPFLRASGWLRKQGQPLSRLSDQNYLKGRKVPSEVAEAWAEIHGTELIKDPAALLGARAPITASDIETRRYMNFLAASPDHMLADDIIQPALDAAKAAERLVEVGDLGASKGVRLFRRVPQVPKSLQNLAGPGGRQHAEFQGKIYRQMPTSNKYGPLSGKFVLEEVSHDLETLYDIPSGLVSAVLRKGTQLFKKSKVTYNPATLMRNIYGQIPLNDLGGVAPYRGDIWAPALRNYFQKGETYLEARRAGLFGGEWLGGEVQQILNASSESGSLLKGFIKQSADWAKAPLKRMERFHEASEQANKMIMYSYARKNLGMAADDAVRYAKRYVFDYREVPRWIQITRQSPFGAPFISFSYKAMPRVLENALAVGSPTQFMRFWKYPMGFAAFNEFSARQLDLVPDEEKGIVPTLKRTAQNAMGLGIGKRGLGKDFGNQRFLPDYVGAQQILLPFRDAFRRELFLDLTWLLPWGDVGEVGKGNIGEALGQMKVPFPRQIEPSNPWLQLMVAAMSKGKDAFTGRNVFPPGSSAGENIFIGGKYVVRQFGPALLGFTGEKLVRSFSGDVEARPDIPTKPVALASGLGGLRTRPLDPRQGAEFQKRDIEKEINAIKGEIARLKRTGGKASTIERRKKAKERLQAQKRELSKEMRKIPRNPVFEAAQRRARR
jgi:hypothetical protein